MSSGSAAFSPIPRDELRLQQLNQLYAQSRLPQWLLLIAAVLISPLAWANSSRPSLLLWIGLLGLLALTRQALVRRYWQASARERLQRRWSLFFHLGNLASGLCLSWVHIALTPIDNFVLQAQMYSIASGVSICVGVLYAPRYSAFASFMLPAWLPLVSVSGAGDVPVDRGTLDAVGLGCGCPVDSVDCAKASGGSEVLVCLGLWRGRRRPSIQARSFLE